MSYKILVLEDNKIDADLISRYLKKSEYNFEVKWVAKKDAFKNALTDLKPDLIVSDYNLRYYNAYEALEIKNKINKDIPLVVISGTIGEEEAVNLIKEGAIDFLIKYNLIRLPQIVMRALEETIEKKEREKAEQALRKEMYFTDKLLNSLSGIFYVMDKDYKIVRVNKSFLHLLGYSWDEVKNQDLHKFIDENDHEKLEKAIAKIGDEEKSTELRLIHKNGCRSHYLLTGTLLKQDKNDYIIGTGIDITERIEVEKQIKEALKEKDVLLAEIHHRVKNNLAVVSGMMQLQAFEDDDERVQKKLMSSVSRIKSIALVHEQMYRSESFSNLRFDESLKLLVENISHISHLLNTEVDVNYDISEIELNINQALPCAIIVNEVVSNIYKHAFKNQDKGEISIQAKQQDGIVQLTIKDNGVGISDDDIQKDKKSLGLKLIHLLTDQLDGNIEIKRNNGSIICLKFKKYDKKGAASAHVA